MADCAGAGLLAVLHELAVARRCQIWGEDSEQRLPIRLPRLMPPADALASQAISQKISAAFRRLIDPRGAYIDDRLDELRVHLCDDLLVPPFPERTRQLKRSAEKSFTKKGGISGARCGLRRWIYLLALVASVSLKSLPSTHRASSFSSII